MTSKQIFLPIGTKVTYVRQNALEDPERGSGTILGYSIDANKRQTAHIEKHTENKEKINVDVKALNPSEKYLKDFAQAIKAIKEISEEGNGKVQEIVLKYNRLVDEIFDEVLSKPIKFDDIS